MHLSVITGKGLLIIPGIHWNTETQRKSSKANKRLDQTSKKSKIRSGMWKNVSNESFGKCRVGRESSLAGLDNI